MYTENVLNPLYHQLQCSFDLLMKLPPSEAFLNLIQELNQRIFFSWNLRTYVQSKKLFHSRELFYNIRY